MKLGCFVLILTIGCYVVGGQALYEAAANRTRKVTTYEQFVRSKPTGGWYEIKGAWLDLPNAAVRTGILQTAKEVFIPVRTDKDTEDGAIHLLVATEDPKILDLTNEMLALNKASEEENLRWLAKNRDRLIVKKDVQGMIRFGINLDSDTRRKIAKLDQSLAPDFVIMDEGKEPSWGAGVGLLALGVFLTILHLRFYGGQSQAVSSAEGAAEPGQQEPAWITGSDKS